MRLFLSHSSRDKPLVREIIKRLPRFLDTWIDETQLTWGTPLEMRLQTGMQIDSDFVIVFVGRDAMNSKWVQREIEWALEKEQLLGRDFLLPILIEPIDTKPRWMETKLYRVLYSRDDLAIRNMGDQIADDLFHVLVRSWDKSHGGTAFNETDIMMSGTIACDHVDVIADRSKGPYGMMGWLGEWQEKYQNGKTEVIVIARTAKWWYEQMRNGAIVPGDSLSINILASDPSADRRLLATEDRTEFSEDLEKVLRHFPSLSRKHKAFRYVLSSTLVLDSFTFVKSITHSTSAVLVILDLYTGTRFDGPRPQIIFKHDGSYQQDHACIVSKLEARARRMLANGGNHVLSNEARRIAKPFQGTEEEPSRGDSPGRLANYAIAAFEFYESISSNLLLSDEIDMQPMRVPAPVCVQIEVTDRCIAKGCLGCSRGTKKAPNEMSLEIFKRLMLDLSHMGTKSIVLSGGEPLIHQNIRDFLEFAANLDMSVALLTDGLAIAGHDFLADVIGTTVSSLRISVDGFTEDAYRKIRNLKLEEGNPIDRLERGLLLLDKARHRKDSRLKHIGVCVTLFKSNIDQIYVAMEWAAKHQMIDSLVFKFAHGTSETVLNRPSFVCSETDIRKVQNILRSGLGNAQQRQLVNTRYMSSFIDTMSVEQIASGKPTCQLYERGGVICFTPILFSLVDPAGGIYLCCHTYYDNSSDHGKRKESLVGSLSNSGFKNIWQETAIDRVRRIHGWNDDKNALLCTCPMRDECTRHWKHNRLLSGSYVAYRRASLTGRQNIANAIRRIAESKIQPFWL